MKSETRQSNDMVTPAEDMFLTITDPSRSTDKHCELNSCSYNAYTLYLIENNTLSALFHHPTLTKMFSNN